MFETESKKRLPYLAGYLEKTSTTLPVDNRPKRFVGSMACLLLGVGAIFVGLAGASVMTLAIGIGTSLVGVLLGLQAIKTPRVPASLLQFAHAHNALHSSAKARKLHRELDPTAAQLLEAGAYHWTRIVSVLEGPLWGDDKIGMHYQSIREQTLQAANEAMRELIVMGAMCTGAPQKQRKDDLKEVIEDFVELDIEDALKGLKRMTSSSSTAYAHRSPNISSVFEPMKAIAENLKSLAGEVEKTSAQASQRTDPLTGHATSTSSIDLVLRELKAMQQAEQELDQNQELRG